VNSKTGFQKREKEVIMKKKRPIFVIISYNPVRGYNSGWHESAKARVFVCANDNGRGCDTGKGDTDYERAGSVMHDLGHDYYNGKVPVKDVKEYIVYSGLYAFRSAIDMARMLKQESNALVTIVACSCEWPEKERMVAKVNIPLIRCECSGRGFLGERVGELLNGG